MKAIDPIDKEDFFTQVGYDNPDDYNERFNNRIAEIEDAEIQAILKENIPEDIVVTDIGCGTGLGRTLIDNEYIGVDQTIEAIEYCKEHHEGTFINKSVEEYIKTVDSLNPITLFSLDYIELDTVEEMIQKTDKVFIAIHYDKPYKSKTSVYSKDKKTYYELHPKKVIKERMNLFKKYNAETYNLLGQDYYYVTIIKK